MHTHDHERALAQTPCYKLSSDIIRCLLHVHTRQQYTALPAARSCRVISLYAEDPAKRRQYTRTKKSVHTRQQYTALPAARSCRVISLYAEDAAKRRQYTRTKKSVHTRQQYTALPAATSCRVISLYAEDPAKRRHYTRTKKSVHTQNSRAPNCIYKHMLGSQRACRPQSPRRG